MRFKRLRERHGPHGNLSLRDTLFVLPNAMTLGSVYCGFEAIRRLAVLPPESETFYAAAVLLCFAGLFDLLDGRVARLTKTQSAFGLQLDSLADLVSFGVAPALLVYRWSLSHLPYVGELTAFLFVACGAVRLARFNMISAEELKRPRRAGKHMLGLPIPPASFILISLVLANHAAGGGLQEPHYAWPLAAVTVALSVLMVSSVRFRSFKNLRANVKTLLVVLLSVGSSAIVWWWTTRPQFVLVWLLAIYVLLGVVESLHLLVQRLRGRAPPSSARSSDGNAPESLPARPSGPLSRLR